MSESIHRGRRAAARPAPGPAPRPAFTAIEGLYLADAMLPFTPAIRLMLARLASHKLDGVPVVPKSWDALTADLLGKLAWAEAREADAPQMAAGCLASACLDVLAIVARLIGPAPEATAMETVTPSKTVRPTAGPAAGVALRDATADELLAAWVCRRRHDAGLPARPAPAGKPDAARMRHLADCCAHALIRLEAASAAWTETVDDAPGTPEVDGVLSDRIDELLAETAERMNEMFRTVASTLGVAETPKAAASA